MNSQKFSDINKKAWDYDTYHYWTKTYGAPEEMAHNIKANPLKYLKWYTNYFGDVSGKSILNICGSNGMLAIALCMLNAELTIVDISEHGKQYATECAKAVPTTLEYVLCDFMDYHTDKLYDISFLYIGIAHYFSDIAMLFRKIYDFTKKGGILLYSDFHPFLKICYGNMDYFDSEPFFAEMPYARYYDSEQKASFPKCIYREYTMSEIINAIIQAGFRLLCFDEKPFKTEKYPCEFVIKAVKE